MPGQGYNVDVPARHVPDVSRCSRCNYPKAFGRTVNSIRDILRPALDLERGHTSDLGRLLGR